MKFDYCLGNPPYNELLGGTNNVDIWQKFIFNTRNLANSACYIHPARFINPKRNMKKTAERLVNECHLASFNIYPSSNDVFPGTSIDGGISVTYFSNKSIDEIKGYVKDVYNGPFSVDEIYLMGYEKEAYHKVFTNINITANMKPYVIGNIGAQGSCESGYIKGINTNKLKDSPENMIDPIHIRCAKEFGTGGAVKHSWYYIEKADLINPLEGEFQVKVHIGKMAYPHTDRNWLNMGKPQILDANTIIDKSLYIIPKHNTEREITDNISFLYKDRALLDDYYAKVDMCNGLRVCA